MEEVIRFIQDFVAQEYQVMIQIRTEPNGRLVEDNIYNLNQLFEGLDSGLNLSSSRTIEPLDTVLRQLEPRELFRIDQYIHSTFGTIYRCFLSSPFRGDHSYFANFYVTDTEKGLKIVARYHICNECDGLGDRRGNACEECHGFGWNWRGGRKIRSLGELVAVKEFGRPVSKRPL